MELPRPPVVLGREAMRTRFEIVMVDDRDPVSLQAAAEAALDEIERVEQELSAFRHDSPLARINVEAADQPVLVDPGMLQFLLRARALSASLEGAFDPTVGAFLSLLRRGEQAPESWAAARARVGFDRVLLDLDARTVAFTQAGVKLDAGAVGKGYALERAEAILREAGVMNALIHGGTSSVCALGAPPGQPGWVVAVQDPIEPGRGLARVTLRDQALGVSGIHGRVYQVGEQRRGHVVDPRSGASVCHTVLAAAVTAVAADADALSTALLVLGADALERLAARFPGCSLLTVTPDHDDHRIDVIGPAFAPS